MHISQTYKELGITHFREVFEIIDHILTTRKIPYYLIGVTAVALELLKDGIKPSRGTKDIDFAIMISSIAEFEAVVFDLEKQGFNKVKAPWTLYHPQFNVAVDLLPFGEIEENDTINFSERYSDLHVLGFKEVLSESIEVQIEKRIVNIPPLAGMILLKLVAWSDRPEERQNDLSDILLVIRAHHKTETGWNELVTQHYDIIPENGEFDELTLSARVLGRKAGHLLLQNNRLQERISYVIAANTGQNDIGPIPLEWAQILDRTVEYAQNLLGNLMLGLREGLKKASN